GNNAPERETAAPWAGSPPRAIRAPPTEERHVPRVIEGLHTDPGGRFAIVVGRFNDFISARLLEGCLDALRRHGVDVEERVDVVWVPGAFEIPLVCQRLAQAREPYA